MVVAIIAAGLLGIVVALPALRVGGHYLVIVTLALQVIVTDVLKNAQGITGGPDGISGIQRISFFSHPITTPGQFFPIAVLAAFLFYLFARRIELSPFGRALRAMREDEVAAQAAGKNVIKMKLLSFAISGGGAAVAGALLAHYITYVGPQTFTVNETITILAMVILGGIGNLRGSVLGATLLVLLPEALKMIALPPVTADMMRNVLYGLMMIAILRWRPEGLVPETHNLPDLSAVEHEGLQSSNPEYVPEVDTSDVTFEARDLRKAFGGVVAARGVNLRLAPGIVNGLIGPNGAGKTTAFNLLTGFIAPDAGKVTLGSKVLNGLRPYQIVQQGIARSFQNLRLFRKMTVVENVLVAIQDQPGDSLLNVFFRPGLVRDTERRNLKKALDILAFVDLRDQALQRADNLSFAEEKLLVIARLLATEAHVLLLDEPLSGLDVTTLREILPTIKKLADAGRILCLIEHNLEVIREVCDHAYYLDEGLVLAEGTPAELMADPELQKRYLK